MMAMVEDPSNENVSNLVSLCSKGVFAKWDSDLQVSAKREGEMAEVRQLIGAAGTKLRHAALDVENERIVAYEQMSRQFLVFDLTSLKQTQAIPQIQEIPVPITGMTVHADKLVYILSKSIVTQKLSDPLNGHKLINRQAKLTSLSLSSDGKILAVGDEFGKIFVLHNFMKNENEAKTVIQSLPQWHANAVTCLKFVHGSGPSKMLMSAGRESVLVQWNLSTQDRSFVSRMGAGPITNLEVDGDFYSCIFADNSFKVFRFDNNRPIIDFKNLQITGSDDQVINCNHQIIESVGLSGSDADSFDAGTDRGNMLAYVSKSKVQFKAVVGDGKASASQQLSQVQDTNPRNYTSSPAPESELELTPAYTIRSLAFSPSAADFMVTVECLEDSRFANKQIFIWQLKIWQRSDDASRDPYKLMQLVHSPYPGPLADTEQVNGNVQPVVKFTNDNQFILAFKDIVQVWQLQRITAKDQKSKRW